MLIQEVADPSNTKLLGLAEFLLGRATDEASPKQISMNAFIKMAQDIGVSITPTSLADIVQKAPLNTIIEPIDPNSNMVKFKGNTETDIAMPVNKAQDVVASAAKRAAAKRD